MSTLDADSGELAPTKQVEELPFGFEGDPTANGFGLESDPAVGGH